MRKISIILLLLLNYSFSYAITVNSTDSLTLSGYSSSYYLNSSNQNTGTLPNERLTGTYSGITKLGTLSTLNVTGEVKGTTFTGSTSIVTDLLKSRTSGPFAIHGITGTQNIIVTNANPCLIGIGIQTPTNRVHINSAATHSLQMTTDGSGHLSTDGFRITQSSASNEISLVQRENAAVRMFTNALERVSILNSGFVGVNVTAPQRQLSVVGDFQVTGNIYTTAPMYQPITTVTSDQLLSATTHDMVLVDATSATVNITLPAASGKSGLTFRVKKIAGSYPVIIDPNASEQIDGATTMTLSAPYSAVSIRTNGTAWWGY